MRAGFSACAFALLLGLASGSHAEEGAQPPPAAPVPPAPPCSSPEHRAFDFWLGAWRVERPAGGQLGHNTVTSILGGCAILEEWESFDGFRGTAILAYDARSRIWRDRWVDTRGDSLTLAGRFDGASMVLLRDSGEDTGASRERHVWTPLEGGSVRYRIETSADGGATWSERSVAIYKRR